MKSILVLLTGFLLVVYVVPCGAQATLQLYDNFHKAAIDSSKWVGEEANSGSGLAREAARSIQAPGRLLLADHAYGLPTDDPSAATVSSQILQTVYASGITAIRTTITVTRAVVKDSAYEAGPALVRAGIGGFYFNAGTPTQGSYAGDVAARVSLDKSSSNASGGFDVFGVVFECVDQDCDTTLPIGARVSLGSVALGQPATVSVQWDQLNQQFIFRHGAATRSVQYAGIVTDTSFPENNFKTLRVDAVVPPCSTTPCTEASIEALFGPVYISP